MAVVSINSLPNELLTEIFVQCMRHSSRVKGGIIPSSSAAPMLLTQICKHWRRLAISTTYLWNSVSRRFRTCDVDATFDPLLDLWLQRAGNRSFSLSIANIPANTLLDLLLDFPNITHLNASPKLERPFLPPTLVTPLPSIESLSLPIRGSHILPWITLPNLRKFVYSQRVELPEIASMIARSACGHTLTTLYVRAWGATPEMRDLLRAAPAVVSLQLHEPAPRHHPRPHPAIIHALEEQDLVPFLEQLEVRTFLTSQSYPALLDILHMRSHTLNQLQLGCDPRLNVVHPDAASRAQLNDLKRSGLCLLIVRLPSFCV